MTVVICDRCGKRTNGNIHWLTTHRLISFATKQGDRKIDYHLCSDCHNSFLKWWGEGKTDAR